MADLATPIARRRPRRRSVAVTSAWTARAGRGSRWSSASASCTGSGFASALGIDQAFSWTLLSSLLVFNVGIESVQLAIIVAVFPLLALLRRRAPLAGLSDDRGDRGGCVRDGPGVVRAARSRNSDRFTTSSRHRARKAVTAVHSLRRWKLVSNLVRTNGTDEVLNRHRPRASTPAGCGAPRGRGAAAAFGIGAHDDRGRAGAGDRTSTGIVLGVGANASQRIVTWYTSANTAQSVQVAPTSAARQRRVPRERRRPSRPRSPRTPSTAASTATPRSTACRRTPRTPTASAPRAAGPPTYSFKTQKFDGDFDFLFFGDPQIGSSGDVAKDGAGWADTLNVSLAANPNAELLVSGGDQVETANTETQWNAFLASDKLRQYPWAATIGNHDVGGKAYDQHFWTPNTDRSAPFYNGSTATQSGGDYWYVYKGVLFIHLNSNAYASGSDAAHVGYVTNVVKAHGGRGQVHGARLPPLDLLAGRPRQRQRQPAAPPGLPDRVLEPRRRSGPAGSRPQLLAQLRDQERPEGQRRPSSPVPPRWPQGPGGVIYVTGNSASGSKYYDLTAPTRQARTTAPTRWTHRQAPLGQLGREPGARPHLREGPGAQDALVVENIRSGTCAAPNAAVELRQRVLVRPRTAAPARPSRSAPSSTRS